MRQVDRPIASLSYSRLHGRPVCLKARREHTRLERSIQRASPHDVYVSAVWFVSRQARPSYSSRRRSWSFSSGCHRVGLAMGCKNIGDGGLYTEEMVVEGEGAAMKCEDREVHGIVPTSC